VQLVVVELVGLERRQVGGPHEHAHPRERGGGVAVGDAVERDEHAVAVGSGTHDRGRAPGAVALEQDGAPWRQARRIGLIRPEPELAAQAVRGTELADGDGGRIGVGGGQRRARVVTCLRGFRGRPSGSYGTRRH
jgi:hypothetical protein